MEQAKRIAKNTGFLYARMAITVFISLYSTRLVLDALGSTDFGIFNVIGGAIAMLAFLNVAMTQATQRFMSYAEGQGDFKVQVGIFNISVLLHWIIGLAVVLVLEVAALFLFDGFLEIPEDRIYAAKVVYQCMVFSTFFRIISVPYDAVINAHQNMFLVAVLGVLEAFLKLGIALYLVVASYDGLITYGVLMALMAVLLLVIRRIYCFRNYDEVIINIKKYYDRSLLKQMGSFAGWSFLGSSTSIVANYGQGIVLNVFFGPVVNAAQGIATQINGQLSAFSTTMLSALNPVIAINEGAGKRESMLKMTAMGSKMSFFLLAFMSVPVLVEMPYILNLWLKDVPEYTIIFCRLLLARTLIEQITIPVSTSIKAVGKIKGFQIASTILNIIPLVLAYLFFQYGKPPYYMYIIFIGYSLVNGVVILWYAKKYTGINIPNFLVHVVLRCFIALSLGLLISSIPLYVLDENLVRLMIIVGLSTV
ncbi:MAG: hypothetical protein AAF361_11605, partial [Bacteroidota bacterium]